MVQSRRPLVDLVVLAARPAVAFHVARRDGRWPLAWWMERCAKRRPAAPSTLRLRECAFGFPVRAQLTAAVLVNRRRATTLKDFKCISTSDMRKPFA